MNYKQDKRETINGSRIVRKFPILRDSWEMDNVGYITEDGNVYTTNHETIVEYHKSEMLADMADALEMMQGIQEALSCAYGIKKTITVEQ